MKKSLQLLVLLAIIVVLPGCIKFKSSTPVENQISTGGIYKSINQGESWAQSSTIATEQAEDPTFMGMNILSFAVDPQDEKAIYAGTEGNGMFLSYNQGQSWQQFETMSQGPIHSIAVHPANKCIIYVSSGNNILKTEDCSRTWNRVYFDTRPRAVITTMAVDWFSPENIFAGTSEGEILQSKNDGKSWRTVHRTDNRIIEILIGADSRQIYVGTHFNGVFVTKDKGATWTKRYDEIQDAGSVEELSDMTLDLKNNVLIIATKHGLMRTTDFGAKWESIELNAPDQSARIYKVATNPGNNKQLYYATASTFFKSGDAGKTWISAPSASQSIPTILHVHPKQHEKLFIGYKVIQQ